MRNTLPGPTLPRAIDDSFDAVVVPHLDAGYRLARWLMRDEHDAQDAMQEASLRAFRYFATFCGGDGRAWFLRIVRNTCYGWRRPGFHAPIVPFDEERHSSPLSHSDPESLLLQTDEAASIARAMSRLPDHFHQLLALREIDGLSYRELADIIGIPIGTVMSRLSRAREALRRALATSSPAGASSDRPMPPGTRRERARVTERLRGRRPIGAARLEAHASMRAFWDVHKWQVSRSSLACAVSWREQ